MRSRFTNSLLGAVGAASLVASSRADTLVDNLNEPTRAVTILGTVPPDNIWAAQAFSGPTTVRLDSIDVLVGNAPDPPDAVAELRSGDDPSGPTLAVFSVPALVPAGLEVATLVPDQSVVLEPGTVYWLVMGTTSTGAFGWAYAFGNEWLGPGSMLAYAYSEDDGLTWGAQGFENPYQMRVNVSAVSGCAADFDGNGLLNIFDFLAFQTAFSNQDPAADFDDNGLFNVFDFLAFQTAFGTGC